MKKFILYISCMLLYFGVIITGCKKTEINAPAPVITVDDSYKNIEGLNEGQELVVPVKVSSPVGLKRLAYYVISNTSNGTSSGEPVFFDRTDAPDNMEETIKVTVQSNFKELVIIAFDINHNNSELHINTDNIRAVQKINFKDNIKERASVFAGKRLSIEGNIVSEYDLSSLSYQVTINGVTSPETAISFEDKRNIPFQFNVDVVENLSAIIINTKNIHDAFVTDTFKIGSVQEDAVVIAIADNKNPVEKLYTTINNTFSGAVFSGTSVSTFTYAVKRNGIYGAEQPLTIGTPADEFNFSFDILGEGSIEAIRIQGENEGGKKGMAEFKVGKVYNPLKEFKNVVLTTEIGPGKNNFFAAYQAPHLFSIENAAPYDEMIDLGFFKYTATSNNIMPPGVFTAGAAYANALAPYMTGFDKAAYTLVTANRASANSTSYDTLHWDTQLMEHIEKKVAAPTAQGGENYNIYETNRRTNNVFNPGQGFYIGWGRWEPILNQSFGIVIVRDYKNENGIGTITLDIKVPMEDQRTKYNPESLFNYP